MLSQLKKSAKSLLIILMFSTPLTGFGQKLEQPAVDQFTNEITYHTSSEWIASNGYWSTSIKNLNIYFSKKNGTIYGHLVLDVGTGEYKRFSVSQGNPILFKLGDNSLVSFVSFDNEISKHNGIGLTSTWTADIPFILTDDDIQKITAYSVTTVTAIRVQADVVNFDYDIKTSDSEKLKNMLQLILNAK